MERAVRGRDRLAEWQAGRPANFYLDDEYLRFWLARRLGAERLAPAEADLVRAGADAAGFLHDAAAELDRPERHPRLVAWSASGERVDDIAFHPLHDEVGRRVWRSGVLAALGEPGHVTLHAALSYLFELNGEVPHLCSIACTAGLIKAIQRAGTPRMKAEWLPRLLDRDYDRRWHGAQFLTEIQGGSDVGANACVARPGGPDGAWRLSGEKWFCSNVAADLYAVSARPEGAPEGTAGVALFVVPRRGPDGRPNGMIIRRLKDKLGTRTLPTAEVEFADALAWPLGRLEDGFRLLMGVIINTSRLAVATAGAAIMRRAWSEASRYARLREAFGRPLLDFPAVRDQLAEMRALGAAGLAFALFVADREDRLALAGAPPEEDALFRSAVNLAKYVCSVDAGLVVHHAIEILGGNGTIEDLSPLPRLWREVPVQESWEGPHNTLMAQLLRDALRAKMHDPLVGHARDLLLGLRAAALRPVGERALAALEACAGRVDALLKGDPEAAAFAIRRVMGRLGRLFQVALLLDAAAAGGPAWLAPAAELLLARLDPDAAVADPGYPALVRRVLAP